MRKGRMSLTTRRRAISAVFAGLALTMALGSVAWACTGTHAGNTWLCATGNPSCIITLRATSPDNDLTYYSNASGLDTTNTYNVKFVSGDHSSSTDTACDSGTVFSKSGGGSATFTTSSGAWSAQGPLVMPNATGTYTICAIPTVSGNGSLHGLITLVE
jgi:hypothetical protein